MPKVLTPQHRIRTRFLVVESPKLYTPEQFRPTSIISITKLCWWIAHITQQVLHTPQPQKELAELATLPVSSHSHCSVSHSPRSAIRRSQSSTTAHDTIGSLLRQRFCCVPEWRAEATSHNELIHNSVYVNFVELAGGLVVTTSTKEFVGDSYAMFEPTFDRTQLHDWFSNLHLMT